MALLTITGPEGCHAREIASQVAVALGFELVDDARLGTWMREEFSPASEPPARAWPAMASSVIARVAAIHHVVLAFDGAEFLFERLAGVMRVGIQALESRRVGNVMLDERVDRGTAKARMLEADATQSAMRKARFGKARVPFDVYDILMREDGFDPMQIAATVRSAAESRGLSSLGPISSAVEAQIQFQLRLQLAKHGIAPAGKLQFARTFGHPSEEVFANLLDFYRIQWQYEPRSFPLQWDKDGKVIEAFTPDFYLPEADLYIELTTMKQALVTKKNRKIKLLKAVYPHIQIQVFYQRDLQDLVMKYGLGA